MASGFNQNSDLYGIYNIVQNTMIRVPKDAIIASLKDFFSKDSKYHYVKDAWGFNFTPNLTDMSPDAGLEDDLTTRVFIGEKNRFDIIKYPAILVKAGSFRYKPISMNRDKYLVEWEYKEVSDGYNRTFIVLPDKYILSGAWEGSISIEIISHGIRERDDLVELVSIFFTDLAWDNLYRTGIAIRPDVSTSSPSESEDRNDKLFHQSVELNIRGEWRREIPINNIIDVISFCVEFGRIPGLTAPNLDISNKIDLSIPTYTMYEI